MKHISSGELVQAKPGDPLYGYIHSSQSSHIDHTDSFAVLVSDVLHHVEKQILVRVPIDLLGVQDANSGKIIDKLCCHTDFPFNDIFCVIVPYGRYRKHSLVCKVPVRIIKNFLEVSCKFAAVRFHSKIDIRNTPHFGKYEIFIISLLNKPHL